MFLLIFSLGSELVFNDVMLHSLFVHTTSLTSIFDVVFRDKMREKPILRIAGLFK